MKPVFYLLAWVLIVCACTSAPSAEADKLPEKDTTAAILASLPYKIKYGNWKPGNPEYTKKIMGLFKAWSDGRVEDVASYFDTTSIYESSFGVRMIFRQPSIIDTFRNWRAPQGVIYTDVIATVSLHNTDYNEDWVCTWTFNKFTNRKGLPDSSLANENWIFKNGKIIRVMTFEAVPFKQ